MDQNTDNLHKVFELISPVCSLCKNWDGRVKSTSGLYRLGFCKVKDKLTWYYEGGNCNQFETIVASNDVSI